MNPRGCMAMAVGSLVAALLGVRHSRTRAVCRAHEVVPSAGRRGVRRMVEGVVIVEFALALAVDLAQDAEVHVVHDRAPVGLGDVIETAVAYGSSWGRSSGPTRRKPTVRSRLAAGCGELPHSGQAVM